MLADPSKESIELQLEWEFAVVRVASASHVCNSREELEELCEYHLLWGSRALQQVDRALLGVAVHPLDLSVCQIVESSHGLDQVQSLLWVDHFLACMDVLIPESFEDRHVALKELIDFESVQEVFSELICVDDLEFSRVDVLLE